MVELTPGSADRAARPARGGSQHPRGADHARGVIFPIAEEEDFVLFDRAANVAAKTILIITRVFLDALILEDLIDSVQRPVIHVIVEGAVKTIGAGFDIGIELSAGRVSEFGLKHVLQQCEFLNCVIGNVNERPRNRLAVVVDTFDCEVVIARALTADRGAFARANAASRGNTGGKEREVNDTLTGTHAR